MDSGRGSVVAVMAAVHRIKKLDSNLLGVSRAFGNFDYKSNTMCLILVCNGIWDVMSNEDVGKFVARRIKELQQDLSNDDDDDEFLWGEVLARVGDKLLTTCLNTGLRDNMSVLIVAFLELGLAFAPLSSTLLLELVASKKEGANNTAVVDGVTRVLAYE
jgi:serine/threonine protein phosphatase PrpC